MSAASRERENVQVALRCRPPRANEIPVTVSLAPRRREVTVASLSSGAPLNRTFTYDSVFGPDASQKDVYDKTLRPLVESALDGLNCAVLVMGPTGSGKTFTLEGPRDEDGHIFSHSEGLIPSMMRHLFEALSTTGTEFNVRVSFLEVFNEELHDLVAGENRTLRIYSDNAGLEEISVSSETDVTRLLRASAAKRMVADAQSGMLRSSRAHSIFTATVMMKETTADEEEVVKIGKLTLVEAAGMEVMRTGAKEERKQGDMSKGMVALTSVICALSENVPHVPYRNSKFTRLLQDSLSGRSKVLVLATISPGPSDIDEALVTLEFAAKARAIRTRPEVNSKVTKRNLIKEYTEEIQRLKTELFNTREKNGVYLPPETYEEMEKSIRRQGDAITDLEAVRAQKAAEFDSLKKMFEKKHAELEEITLQFTQAKEDLVHARRELEKEEAALDRTKMSVVEHGVVIEEHLKTGQRLHNEAESMLGTLHSSLSDINGLFQKIDRKKRIEDENLSAAHRFHGSATTFISGLEAQLSDMRDSQMRACNDLSVAMSSAVASKQDELATLSERAGTMVSVAEEDLAPLLEKNREHQEQMQEAMNSMTCTHKEFVGTRKTNIAAFEADTVSTLRTLLKKIQLQRDKILSWSHEIQANIQESQNALKQHVAVQQEHLAAMQSGMQESTVCQIQHLKEQDSAMEAFLEQESARGASTREAIMTSLRDVLSSRQDQRRHESSMAADLWKENARSTLNRAGQMGAQILETVKSSSAHAHAHHDASEERRRQMQAALSAGQEAESMVLRCRDVAMSAKERMVESVTSQCDGIEAQTRSAVESVQRATHLAEALTATNKAFTENAHMKCIAIHKEATSVAVACKTELERAFALWAEQVCDKSTALNQFCEVFDAEIANVCASIAAFSEAMQNDIPTGGTPIKKEIHLPDSLSRTQPFDAIVRMWHESIENKQQQQQQQQQEVNEVA